MGLKKIDNEIYKLKPGLENNAWKMDKWSGKPSKRQKIGTFHPFWYQKIPIIVYFHDLKKMICRNMKKLMCECADVQMCEFFKQPIFTIEKL